MQRTFETYTNAASKRVARTLPNGDMQIATTVSAAAAAITNRAFLFLRMRVNALIRHLACVPASETSRRHHCLCTL